MRMRFASRWRSVILVTIAAVFAISFGSQGSSSTRAQAHAGKRVPLHSDLSPFAPGYIGVVFTQIPASRLKDAKPRAGGMLPAQYGEGGRLVLLSKVGKVRILTPGFESAADPAVSFDGKRILFAGKKSAADAWNIYEMNSDGTGLRQITRGMGNCRTPMYQSALFYLNDPKPSYQITFASDVAGEMNEYGPFPATNLYSIRFDGSGLRRLTYGISNSYDPFQMQDGRILFSHWLRSNMQWGARGRIDLFGVNLDGTDYAAFSGLQGRRITHMACTTPTRMVVFVESDSVPWDGAGSLATLSLRRNFHSYKVITTPADGLFHSPSALPDGSILVSRRSSAGGDTHSIYRMDLQTRQRELVFADPVFHNIQAVALVPRAEPDGHSSVVEDNQNWSKLYCLNVGENDLKPGWMPPGTAKRVRILEGVPRTEANADAYLHNRSGQDEVVPGATPDSLSGMIPKRLLGDVELDADGSFHLSIPPNTPVQVQIVDADGMALRTSAWIWTKNKENRGCIGCHEDNELSPDNVFPQALSHPAAQLTLPPERRRTVDFRRDVVPILAAKCATGACHGGAVEPRLSSETDSDGFPMSYRRLLGWIGGPSNHDRCVHPGRARTSRLVWAIVGRNTSRPWDHMDARRPIKRMPPPGAAPLTEDEKRTIIEWIDFGAQFSAPPSHRVQATTPSSGGQ
jgi:hypothetical protein